MSRAIHKAAKKIQADTPFSLPPQLTFATAVAEKGIAMIVAAKRRFGETKNSTVPIINMKTPVIGTSIRLSALNNCETCQSTDESGLLDPRPPQQSEVTSQELSAQAPYRYV
jgi:hypothetical protein